MEKVAGSSWLPTNLIPLTSPQFHFLFPAMHLPKVMTHDRIPHVTNGMWTLESLHQAVNKMVLILHALDSGDMRTLSLPAPGLLQKALTHLQR